MYMFSNVAESFSNNLIVEDRYRMILDGLQVAEKRRGLTSLSALFFIINPCILPQANQISNKQRHKGN